MNSHEVTSLTAETGSVDQYQQRQCRHNIRMSWDLLNSPQCSNPRDHHRVMDERLNNIHATLKRYNVDPDMGFLPEGDPLQRLSHPRYQIWEDLGDDLPKLLAARLGQARVPLGKLTILGIDALGDDHRELRRAHLLLCLFAHSYVWGGPNHLDYIPEGSHQYLNTHLRYYPLILGELVLY